jgi:inorganic triphosphatase YgiF
MPASAKYCPKKNRYYNTVMINTLEIEAKFTIPNAVIFAELAQLTHLDEFAVRSIGIKIVIDRYLDTPAKQLLQAGYACRIRESKGKKILAIKSLVAVTGEVHRRLEIEMDVDDDQPQTWDDGAAKTLVLGLTDGALLDTLFTIYQTRHKFYVFQQEKRILELSLDKVSFFRPATVDYFGLEAELIEDGTDADLNHFTRAIMRQWPLQADSRSKFERAFAALNLKLK